MTKSIYRLACCWPDGDASLAIRLKREQKHWITREECKISIVQ